MLSLAFLLMPIDPTVPGTVVSVDAQWRAVLACPKLIVPRGPIGTGVIIGAKDGYAYVLTAAHVVPLNGVEMRFTSRAGYPKEDWVVDTTAEVLARWPDPDIALIRFVIPKDQEAVPPTALAAVAGSLTRAAPTWKERDVPFLPLAGPGQRTKTFPATAWSVGVGSGEAGVVWMDQVRGRRFVRDRVGASGAFFWETGMTPVAGRSGGPLLDENQRVIGICTAIRSGYGYYTHLDEILAALKRGGYGWLISSKP